MLKSFQAKEGQIGHILYIKISWDIKVPILEIHI